MHYPNTLSQPEIVYFLGIEYRLMGGKRKYYLSQSKSTNERKNPKGLHVAIWEHYHGKKLPLGHEVHHRDENTFNNSPKNLENLTHSEHGKIHADLWRTPKQLKHLEKVRHLSVAWHRSPEGREWHRRHASTGPKPKNRENVCLFCGNGFKSYRMRKWCSHNCSVKWSYHEKKRGVAQQ